MMNQLQIVQFRKKYFASWINFKVVIDLSAVDFISDLHMHQKLFMHINCTSDDDTIDI